MEKIKNAIKSAYQWLDKEGGMLHLLACYAMMLTFAPIGFGWASLITWGVAIAKEICDIARKSDLEGLGGGGCDDYMVEDVVWLIYPTFDIG